ncbi:MAG TPA: methyltransferase domain-containing protein [Kofleriaceae bacterium]|jgi:predicted methyltransferase
MHRIALAMLLIAACHKADTHDQAKPAASVDPALTAVLSNPARTDAERARDKYRHPAETLAFFGLKPDMHVVELVPGGGWYTAILAPYLHDKGALAVTSADPNGGSADEGTTQAQKMAQRLASSPVFDKVTTVRMDDHTIQLGPDGSADMVVTFRNIHNWIPAGTAPSVFAAVAKVLKPGGVFGVEDHRATKDLTTKEVDDTGYVSEAQVIALAKAAGLELEARSEINANPKDTKDHPHGVWSLPPSYAGKDVDHDKFAAIGESDRMTLRFRKPR